MEHDFIKTYDMEKVSLFLTNHRKHQKVHSGIVSGRQGPEQARTLARRHRKKTKWYSKIALSALTKQLFLISFCEFAILRKRPVISRLYHFVVEF